MPRWPSEKLAVDESCSEFYTLHNGYTFHVIALDAAGKVIKKAMDAAGEVKVNMEYTFDFKRLPNVNVNNKKRNEYPSVAKFDVDFELNAMKLPNSEDTDESYDSLRTRVIETILKEKKHPWSKIKTKDEYEQLKNPDTYAIKKDIEQKDKKLAEQQKRIQELEASIKK